MNLRGSLEVFVLAQSLQTCIGAIHQTAVEDRRSKSIETGTQVHGLHRSILRFCAESKDDQGKEGRNMSAEGIHLRRIADL